MGHKPLTFPAFLIVMLLLALGITAILAWGGNISPEMRQIGRISFFSCLAALPFCFTWHFFISKGKEDLHPDILACVYPPASILQLGDCHVVSDIVVGEGGVRFMFCIQNRFDHDVNVSIKIKPWTTWQFPNRYPPPIQLHVQPCCVYLVSLWRGVESVDKDMTIKLHMHGMAKGRTRGKQVRFAYRQVFDTGTPGWMTALGALGGAIVFGGKREWRLPWPAHVPISNLPDDEDWVIQEIWNPKANQAPSEICQSIQLAYELK